MPVVCAIGYRVSIACAVVAIAARGPTLTSIEEMIRDVDPGGIAGLGSGTDVPGHEVGFSEPVRFGENPWVGCGMS